MLRVPRHKRDRLAALGLAGGRFLLLSAIDEVHGTPWYHLIQAGKALGLDYAGHRTADPVVFAALATTDELPGALPATSRADTASDGGEGAGGGGATALHARTDRIRTTDATDGVGSSEPTADERQAAETARDIEAMVARSSPLEWFRAVIQRCMNAGASDLHLEVRDAIAHARVRLDGRMRPLGRYPARIAVDGISAAYTMLAEERSRSEVAFNGAVPQAAMIPLDFGRTRLTLRYQSHPAVGGLDVVIRLLRAAGGGRPRLGTLETLGYTPWQARRLNEALASAWGGVFVAGVTGSGKTTTLNTMMALLAREGSRKLFTIEDPVEYETAGVSHLSIQRGAVAGADPFHAAMLAFLRMDPDVGLFGEIRDALSAGMAQAAIQTGHKILSTVHATSALGILGRLSSRLLGLAREDLCDPEFISALVYQVLMPLNCEHCKRPAVRVMSPDALQVWRDGFGIDPLTIHCASANGCTHCRRPGIDYPPGADDDTDARNGTAGVKVGAEVIVPDLRLLDLLRQGRDAEARRHWRRRRTASFTDPDMDGKDAWGHVLHDVAAGRVDPFHFERTFGSALLLAQTLAADEADR
ncbi:hypothetical protein CDN99_07245 [Roseateles aquatilis]|uniref:Bacterial type II secretion system protein E domain-containing protein n=2 Tax=Roseateles aquatilis TaxID=431061 RepID=A0A246JHK0_9BURK|nr:hypothetical protein CDN99_07245 [Roseateles aquatilis]